MVNTVNQECLVVFTYQGKGEILAKGYSGNWRFNKNRAKRCQYLICVQLIGEWGKPEAPSHTAFLIGKISDIKPNHTYGERNEVHISEYAEISISTVNGEKIKGNANPVAYYTLQDFGIDVNTLEFHQVVPTMLSQTPTEITSVSNEPLTIPEAKRRLALTLGIDESQISITINT
ncbi:hypothetical protein LU293_05300 [Moraxella nasovis]|uniref:hypothetical protein n=1 Tax=Moraxella nasovis TaxID=2904121 RepID=UPI001F612F1B|nr:hypothetical protein [Moraxella nasovis]UNU72541.1 hypothetical protein LU293_05300 [Moraxella nasovis]